MKLRLDDWQKDVLATKGNLHLRSGRQTGKSTIVSIKAAETAVKTPKMSIMIISAVERQAFLLFEKVLAYLMDNYKTWVLKGKDRPTKSVIKLTNGSIIRCLPTGLSGMGIRGYTVNLLIGDEAAFINPEVWQAVTPMLATTAGDIWLISTPFGRKGYFYECSLDESFTCFHVNSIQVAKDRPVSRTWTALQSTKSLEFFEQEKKRMSILQYQQEYLGNWVDDLIQLFPDTLIKKCMTTKRPSQLNRQFQSFLGCDFARMGEDSSTFEVLQLRNDRLIQVENMVTRKTLTTDTIRLVEQLHDKYNFKKLYLDDAGLGAGIFDALLESIGDKVVGLNNSRRSLTRDGRRKKQLLKEDLYLNLLKLMEKGEINLLDDPEIFLSLKSVQFEYSEEGQLRIGGTNTHIAEGLIRAAYSVVEKPLNIWCRYN